MKRRIILAGGSGFLGGALARSFLARGDEVVILTRSPQNRSPGVKEVGWDANILGDWAVCLDGADVVVNLTGRSVDCRYTAKNRERILNSRVNSTRVLGEAIARCKFPPRVWLNCSSATIYKHSFQEPMDEAGEIKSTPEAKDEFSIAVVQRWEKTLDLALTPHTRKVAMRAAMVLGREGGVFPVFKRLARLGLGGHMAGGRQMVSWIHEDDFCRAIDWLLEHEEMTGPVNLTAPNPLSNRELMCQVRKACGVPFGLPSPRWMLDIGSFFIRTETELIIKSRYVVPGRLLAPGFRFRYPELNGALADLTGPTFAEVKSLNPIERGAR